MKAKFKNLAQRKIPWLCIGWRDKKHQSRGDTFFLNQTGPYCYHCAHQVARQNRSIIEQ